MSLQSWSHLGLRHTANLGCLTDIKTVMSYFKGSCSLKFKILTVEYITRVYEMDRTKLFLLDFMYLHLLVVNQIK